MQWTLCGGIKQWCVELGDRLQTDLVAHVIRNNQKSQSTTDNYTTWDLIQW